MDLTPVSAYSVDTEPSHGQCGVMGVGIFGDIINADENIIGFYAHHEHSVEAFNKTIACRTHDKVLLFDSSK